mmetsp:Transcript_224/g.418  ORF Transcript_224/g.418 Transcript_224/m.418 type:complete len:548 (+) Transcript_224:200-1843(+)
MTTLRLRASILVVAMALASDAFVHYSSHTRCSNDIISSPPSSFASGGGSSSLEMWPFDTGSNENCDLGSDFGMQQNTMKQLTAMASTAALAATLVFSPLVASAENELADKYGGKGFDSSLVDQNCLVDRCSVQAKACLADDPSCRKGLTCTAKCLGDNSCITGCFARFGNKNLDNLLKCTIEDHDCIKIAILPGGADKLGEEPRSPKATVANFDYKSLEGTWYKVVGFNPNYDCYACQRNTFALPSAEEKTNSDTTLVAAYSKDPYMNMGVEFAMPHLLPDGTPPPPKQVRESLAVFGKEDLRKNNANTKENSGLLSIGLNEYNTNEVMVFDDTSPASKDGSTNFVLNRGKANEASYSRTAHSEGEMFGLKFWENWYVIGDNDPGMPEFKFIYYNGKTRQNTYDGAFVYSRSKTLEPESMAKVYAIAKEAGMNPEQFCRIRNGCFDQQKEEPLFGTDKMAAPSSEPLRGLIASTKVSELLGVEAVSARDANVLGLATSKQLQPEIKTPDSSTRPWWYEVADYLENPHRHFEVMDSLRKPMDWPESVQ